MHRSILVFDGRQLDVRVAVENRAHLACDTHHGKAIRAVRRDLAVEHGIGRAVVLSERHAHGRLFRQNHDAGMVTRKPQLAGRAIHAAAYDAAKLALLDLHAAGKLGANECCNDMIALLEVLRAADNLERLRLAVLAQVEAAYVHPAHPHVVGIRVRLLRNHLRRDHMVERLAHRIDRLDLRAGADELRRKLLWRFRHIYQRLQPVIRYFHLIVLLVTLPQGFFYISRFR